MILGVTGSLGSGKSTVAEMLVELTGAKVIDADAIARRVQEPGGAAYDGIVGEFGRDILAEDGSIDRARLAAIVFSDPAKLAALNAIVHPAVRREEFRLLEELKDERLVVFMVPLLFENGLDRMADAVAVVTVTEDERLRRLARRSGWSAEEVRRRLAAQMPQEEKARRADHVIDNSGTLEQTREQVARLVERLGMNPKPGTRGT